MGTYPKYTELFPGYGYFVTYNFDLRCHTKYMLVPAGFSNADFEDMETVISISPYKMNVLHFLQKPFVRYSYTWKMVTEYADVSG